MDNDAVMVIFIKVPRKWVIHVNGVWSDINKDEIKRYKYLQLRKIKYNGSVMTVCLSWNPMTNLLIQIRIFVRHLRYYTLPICNPDALSSILHIRLYVPVDFIHDIFFSFSFFFRIYFPTKIHVSYITKGFRENCEGFQRFFSADHVWWCYMCAE